MISQIITWKNQLFDILQHLTGGMISRYGFYMPGDNYTFVFWSDLIILLLLLLLMYYWLRYMSLKRKNNKPEDFTGERCRENERNSQKVSEFPEYENRNSYEYSFKRRFNFNPETEYIDGKLLAEQIYNAICSDKNIFIEYVKSDGTESERVVEPYRVYQSRGSNYIEGYCYLRHAERNFKLSRISHLELV